MSGNETIVRFDTVSFDFGEHKPVLEEASFNIRKGSKVTIMGQNGAGKSTIFRLIRKKLKPEGGIISVDRDISIATAEQTMDKQYMELTMREYFEKQFEEKIYDIDRKIKNVLEVVNFDAPYDRLIKDFSGGQQARLLLASALIQDPDLLLLDEPTNNLDSDGIDHLTGFLIMYSKTCVVISHDAEFLNTFSDGVLYLDSYTHEVEQYVGDYYEVVKQITSRIEKENMKNARLAKVAQANKDKAEKFAHKGGKLRLVARKMREKAADMEENMVDVRREDRPIRNFEIPTQQGLSGQLIKINSLGIMKNGEEVQKETDVSLRKNFHLLLKGPNGIGKSTLLERMANGTAKGVELNNDVKIGYYKQDFSTLDFEQTGYEALASVVDNLEGQKLEEHVRSSASRFLLTSKIINTKIGDMSEGQKGLIAFAQLMLMKPGILILDEPTNHINFRHLPIIAKALNEYKGAMILVSHVPDFVAQIRIDEVLDLAK